MPTYVNPNKCDGRGVPERPAAADVRSTEPFGEERYLGVERLPAPGAA